MKLSHDKIYLVELLRFISSISVLIYHYQVYFFQYNKYNEIDVLNNLDLLPFNSFLQIFYKYGDYGVQMFWCLSGFIMSYIYLDKIKFINKKTFFINRFSRLYPLHFITLIFVSIIQFISLNKTGSFQLFDFNDVYHFFLHLGFASAWGLEKGMSFNMPIWSVSLEVIVYLLFYVLVVNTKKLNLNNTIILLIICSTINKIFIGSELHNDLISCIQLFLTGIIIYQLFQKLKKRNLLLFSLLLLMISLVGNFKIFIFCPAVIIFILAIESYFFKILHKDFLSFLGNLTYSLYLWQTPIAMITLIIIEKGSEIFLSTYFFILYFFFLLVLSYFSYVLIERKFQKFIKSNF